MVARGSVPEAVVEAAQSSVQTSLHFTAHERATAIVTGYTLARMAGTRILPLDGAAVFPLTAEGLAEAATAAKAASRRSVLTGGPAIIVDVVDGWTAMPVAEQVALLDAVAVDACAADGCKRAAWPWVNAVGTPQKPIYCPRHTLARQQGWSQSAWAR